MTKNVTHTVVFSADPVRCHPYTHIPVFKSDEKGVKIDPPVIDHYNDKFFSGGEHYNCFRAPVYAMVHLKAPFIDIKFEMYSAVVKRKFDGHMYFLQGTNLANFNHLLTRPSRQVLAEARAKWCKEYNAVFDEKEYLGAFKDQHPIKLMNPSDRFINICQDYIQPEEVEKLMKLEAEKFEEECRKHLTKNIDALVKQLQFEIEN